jgi:hypothetical protein
MPTFNNFLRGGRAVAGNALDPRSRRANTAQADTYWSGVSSSGPNAIGGIGPSVATGNGYRYLQFNSTGALTVTGAGTFTIYSFGGGQGGGAGNGYNFFPPAGSGGGNGTITKVLSEGTYTITVGAGGAALSRNPVTAGTDSYFGTDNTVGGTYGVQGAGGAGGTGINGNGAAGTDVSPFIGGSSLFKGAGGGTANTGLGGSGVGGNGGGAALVPGGTAAANTASGGGSGAGAGQPTLEQGYGGGGGSGVVYVRWRA